MLTKNLKELVREKVFPAEIGVPEDLLNITTNEIALILRRNIRHNQVYIRGFYAESMTRMGLLIPVSGSEDKYVFTELARQYP